MPETKQNPKNRESLFCAHCGTENNNRAYSCTRCGERIYFVDSNPSENQPILECSECRTPNEIAASYCAGCGTNLDELKIEPTSDENRRLKVVKTVEDSKDTDAVINSSKKVNYSSNKSINSGDPVASFPEAPKPTGELEKPETKLPNELVNDSGTRRGRLPSSLRGWNTAAFLIGPVWGPANGVWLGVISLIFLVIPTIDWGWRLTLYLIFGLILGYYGNLLAWRGRKWDSAEHFKKVQDKWMILGLVINILVLIFVVPIIR